jgi:hypothetical protein
MTIKIATIENALRPLPEDTRDFSLAGVFDQIDLNEIPKEDFVVAMPLRIKDQGNTDYCSAYAVTEVSEDQEGEELLPEYQFYKTKVLMDDFEGWGADLRSACKVPARFGSLPLQGYEKYTEYSRQDILKHSTWPLYLDEKASQYKKETYFKVDGRYDTFDNIRCALWQHRDEKRSIVVGAIWRDEWTQSENGVIPEGSFKGGYGHAFKIFGQKYIDGECYLVAQLSNSTEIGNKGIFYFPRSVVNSELKPFGQFMFKDISRNTAEFYLNSPVTKQSTWWKILIARIIYFISNK